MASRILQDLLDRRVPQILGLYLAVGWGVLEFTDWVISRYVLSPRLADLGLTAWACMIPTVLLLAYNHGARGSQRWTRLERIGIPANALLAAAVLALVARGPLPDAELGRPVSAAAALEPTRIAVLYFEDESERHDQGHLANAFTGALIDELTQVQVLDVVPRGAVKPYRDVPPPLDTITRALQAGTLVEGSVSGSKEHLVVSVTLIDAATQSNIDSFTLEGSVDDWADLRGELATEVARKLRRRLGLEIRLRERQAGTRSHDALALLEAAGQLRQEATTLEAVGDTTAAARQLGQADSLLARAELEDPKWVEPIVERGQVAAQRAGLATVAQGMLTQEDVLRGLFHAVRALEIDSEDAGALELRGTLLFEISQSPKAADPAGLRQEAERYLRKAVAADPFRAGAWAALSELRRIDTRFAEAKRDAERALEADPFLADASRIIFQLYETSLELRELEESVRWCDEGHRRFPEDYSFVACSLFLLALPGGPEPEAGTVWALADTMLLLSPPRQQDQLRPIAKSWAAAALARAGLADSAVSVSESARAQAGDDVRPWIDYLAANVRLLLGQREEAIDLLASFLEAIPQRKEYIASDWMFEELWEDPRFKALVTTE